MIHIIPLNGWLAKTMEDASDQDLNDPPDRLPILLEPAVFATYDDETEDVQVFGKHLEHIPRASLIQAEDVSPEVMDRFSYKLDSEWAKSAEAAFGVKIKKYWDKNGE